MNRISIYNTLFLILSSLLFFACNKPNPSQNLIQEKLESSSSKEVVRDLLILNENNIIQLSRILACSPSTIKRIVIGESFATEDADKQFRNILQQALLCKEKNLDFLDPYKHTWSYAIKNFFEKNWLIFSIMLLISIIMHFLEEEIAYGFYVVLGIFLIFYLIFAIYVWKCGEPINIDTFKNTLDPIWEIPSI